MKPLLSVWSRYVNPFSQRQRTKMSRARAGGTKQPRCRMLELERLEDRTLLTAGFLDPTFGVGGKVTTDFGISGNEVVRGSQSVAVQADGKVVVAGSADFSLGVVRYNSDGSLDTTFAQQGIGTYDLWSNNDNVSVVVQADGKLVVSAEDYVARLTSDGRRDTTFATDGVARIPSGSAPYFISAGVAVQADGKIVVGGTDFDNSDLAYNHLTVARLNADGSLDSTFAGGSTTLDGGNGDEWVSALAVQPDGKVLIGCDIGFYYALVRYNSDGTLDSGFNGTGILFPSGIGFIGGNEFSALAVQADGRIVLGTLYQSSAGGSDALAARLNADGSFDNSFSGGGVATVDFGSAYDEVTGLAVQPDGRIVLAGSTYLPAEFLTGHALAMARLNTDGSLDNSFGAGGLMITDFGSDRIGASGVTLQPDGKIIVAAQATQNTTGDDFGLARFEGDPSLFTQDGLQSALDSQPPTDPHTGNPTVTLQGNTQAQADAFVALFHAPSTPDFTPLAPPAGVATPTDIVVTFSADVQLHESTLVIPTGIRVQINGGTWIGGSPALTLSSGDLTVTGATFVNATDAPTILVTGGHLTLRHDVVQESTGYNQAAIKITGGTVDLGTAADPGGNTLNLYGTGAFVRNTTSNPIPAVGDTFEVNGIPLAPSSVSGTVFVDFNDDGQVDFGEKGIAGVNITLTGTDFLGNVVNLPATTDIDGAYVFLNLRPGSYRITEAQPAGYLQGIDTVGTAGGGLAATDQFFVQLAQAVDGLNYNYGERPPASGSIQKGQSAGIGFWNNKNGQALILALNGGTGAELANWLAATLPNMFGIHAGGNNLTGKNNAYVANLFQQDFLMKGMKLDAQVLATALSVYATNATLDSTAVAARYGFTVSGTGLGTDAVNVGGNGDAFGVANNSVLTVLDLLRATDAQAVNGVFYGGNTTKRNAANNVYSAVNQAGNIS